MKINFEEIEKIENPCDYSHNGMFTTNEAGEYTKWLKLFSMEELNNIAGYGYTFIKDNYYTNKAMGIMRDDGHIYISFELDTGRVDFVVGAEQFTITDMQIIVGIQQRVIDKVIKKNRLGVI